MHICLFDIDGTLLASGGAGKAALESSLVEEFSVSLRSNIPYSGRTDRAIARDLLHSHDIEPTDENREKLLNGYLRRLPHCLTHYNGRVLPGVLELLQTLQNRDDVVLGLLTGNVRAGARVKLGHFGLFDFFGFGGFGDRHFDRDDVAREAFLAVCDHLACKVAGNDIWVIGDTPLDIQCARAIGAKVAAVATGVHTLDLLQPHTPDLLFEDLSDHSAFLDQLA